MGFFKRSQVKEEPARHIPEAKNAVMNAAVNESESKLPQTTRQWKKTMKEAKKIDNKAYESKKLDRSIRMDSLLAQSNYHRQGQRPSLKPQRPYSPNVSPTISPLKKVAKVGWGTVSIGATRSLFGSSKK
jgi:hypothetical protein